MRGRSMALSMRNRHLLTLDDFSSEEIASLLQLSAELKAAKYAKTEVPRLRGKNIVLIFEKDSTRTRCAFEVAAFDQGAHVTYIGASGSHIGYKETIKDTARVLGRMYDGIEYRGSKQATVEELARYAGVPVWNGLTDEEHPTQALADLFTMQEQVNKPLAQVKCCFLGDTGFNVATSLLSGSVKMGLDIRLAGPQEYWPSKERLYRRSLLGQYSCGPAKRISRPIFTLPLSSDVATLKPVSPRKQHFTCASGLFTCSCIVNRSARACVGCSSSVKPFHTGTPA